MNERPNPMQAHQKKFKGGTVSDSSPEYKEGWAPHSNETIAGIIDFNLVESRGAFLCLQLDWMALSTHEAAACDWHKVALLTIA
jgi:hypothetical protein